MSSLASFLWRKNLKSDHQGSFIGLIFSLVLITPVHAEHQEAYLCTYNNEPEELVIGTALGVRKVGDIYYEDLKWTKNGRRLIFSYLMQANSPDSGIVKRDQQGREWLEITKTDRGSGTMWLGTGKMGATQYRGPIIYCKVGLRLNADRFMNDAHKDLLLNYYLR